MTLLLEVFAFLTVVLRGLTNVAQAVALGGVVFLLALALPLRRVLGETGTAITGRTRLWIACAALALACVDALVTAAKIAVLADTTGLNLGAATGADFVIAAAARVLAALALAAWARRGGDGPGSPGSLAWLGLSCLVLIGSTIALSHAIARPDHRLDLAIATACHWLGASAWIGGLPYFLFALARLNSNEAARAVGRRYSAISIGGVVLLAAAGLYKSVFYVGDAGGIWGTAYGVMVSTKVVLLAALLAFGLANFLAIRRLAAETDIAVHALRRRTEVEFAIGLAVFFVAASLTSVPPSADLPDDRASWADVVTRMTPALPRLRSPNHADLSIQQIQAQLDSRAQSLNDTPRAYVPGSGMIPADTAADTAWSEFNHNWAGVFVTLIGVVALLERLFGWRWARGWPLIFVGLAVFLIIRSDPNAWPLGQIGFLESLRDADVLQHRLFMLLIVVFGLFEWAVRTGRIVNRRAALVFPALCILSGGLLLAHTHAVTNFREELLMEITHIPIALLGLAAGAARWLELRLPEGHRAVAASIWPPCLLLSGLLLLTYHE